MYKINIKTLLNWFGDFLLIHSKTHYYPTRFATGNNYSLFIFNKANSQRFIRYEGPKLWNEYQMNLKIKLIKADMPLSKAQNYFSKTIKTNLAQFRQ